MNVFFLYGIQGESDDAPDSLVAGPPISTILDRSGAPGLSTEVEKGICTNDASGVHCRSREQNRHAATECGTSCDARKDRLRLQSPSRAALKECIISWQEAHRRRQRCRRKEARR
jgi:hypothetical protein